jgi:hypothetical protein
MCAVKLHVSCGRRQDFSSVNRQCNCICFSLSFDRITSVFCQTEISYFGKVIRTLLIHCVMQISILNVQSCLLGYTAV